MPDDPDRIERLRASVRQAKAAYSRATARLESAQRLLADAEENARPPGSYPTDLPPFDDDDIPF